MKKRDYLIQALMRDSVIHKGELDAPWLISLLCITQPKEEPNYPYAFKVEEGKGYAYIPTNEDETQLEWVEIEDYKPNEPLFLYNEAIMINPGEVLNNPSQEAIETSVGLLIMNVAMLIYPFGNKIPYINKKFNAKDIEKHVAPRLTDDPDINGDDIPNSKDPNVIHANEYLKFTEGALWLTNFTQVCVPGVTRKALLPPPDAEKRLEELLKEHEGQLDDPTTIVKIMDELIAMDKDYLKGDRSMGFLVNPNKDFNIVRSRLFLTHGYGMNFKENGGIDYIPQPLTKGTDLSKLPEYTNISRAGTFSRAAETMLGGVAVKELLRASNNLKMDGDDCGSQLGLATLITEKNKNYYVGFSGFINGKTTLLTKELLESKVGTIISIRNPAFCKTSGTGYCRTCCGPNLARHPTGLSSAISALGSAFMYLMMKAMHGKVAAVKKVNYKDVIS